VGRTKGHGSVHRGGISDGTVMPDSHVVMRPEDEYED
jgi:hypothetical protein